MHIVGAANQQSSSNSTRRHVPESRAFFFLRVKKGGSYVNLSRELKVNKRFQLLTIENPILFLIRTHVGWLGLANKLPLLSLADDERPSFTPLR